MARAPLLGLSSCRIWKTRRAFPPERRFGKRAEKRLMDAGLILRCDPNWIAFGPPLITTLDQADEMVDIFVRCLADEIAGGR
ncbi:unnamed protein product [marine sediment metagenome]|uniref:Uncharacterized protein n=1 Tax=marine sediment metagenome TaxID=412755 RepID=X0YBI0_9ZZZZ